MASTALSVRLDERALDALTEIRRGTNLSQSEAIREALVETAFRRRQRRDLAAEARILAEDDADRREMAAIAELMEDLRVPW